jgi:hypothetical protein
LSVAPTTAKVRNLSAGGISLVVDRDFEPQSVLTVQLVNTERNVACSLKVRVVYTVPHPSGDWILGGAFTRQLSEEELKAFVTSGSERGM